MKEKRQFAVVVRFAPSYTNLQQAISRLPVFTADGIPVPLGQVARIELKDGRGAGWLVHSPPAGQLSATMALERRFARPSSFSTIGRQGNRRS